MTTKYKYSISVDFPEGKVYSSALQKEVEESTIVQVIKHINTDDDDCDICFDGDLSTGDKTILDGLVTSHVANPIDGIKKMYIQKEQDGKDYFNQMRAELVNLYLIAQITEDDAYEIEDKLDIVGRRILKGDWKSALKKITAITPSGALSQEIYDGIFNYITDYVTNNY